MLLVISLSFTAARLSILFNLMQYNVIYTIHVPGADPGFCEGGFEGGS